MPNSQGSRSQLLYKVQSAFGTAATGAFKTGRFARQSLKLEKGTVESEHIRSDREVQDFRHTTRSVSGDIEFELCDVDHEDWISSAMFRPWNTDVISIGTQPQYITFEDGALDIGRYQLFQDCLVSKMVWRFVPADILKCTASIVGTTMTLGASTVSVGTTAPTNNPPYDSLTGAVYDNPAETGSELAYITSIELTIDNRAAPTFAIGQSNAVAIEYQRGRVTGTMTAYYQDATWPTRFLNETESALVLNFTDPAGNNLEFRMDRIKVNGADAAVQNEQSRMLTVPFIALRPAAPQLAITPSALVINKS